MTVDDVKGLPIARKVQLMEALWEDLRVHFEAMDLPQQQKDLLDQRRTRAQDGTARILDWDTVKGSIGRA